MYSNRENGGASLKVNLAIPLLFLTSIALAQSPGRFSATGSMTTARFSHTATLLANGKVLIAGGNALDNSPAFSSGELYDPSTGTFSATGDMMTARYAHTATLLPTGKVLIAGGISLYSGSIWASAELFDPSTGFFTVTGNMTTRRAGQTATLLNDGKVLITGGSDSGNGPNNEPSATAELYDPSTGAFSRTGDMTAKRSMHIATLLSNGNVLIVPGGEGCCDSAELYDPDAGTFSPTGWKNVYGMVAATANLLTNGKVLVTLTVGECDVLSDSAELYDPSSGTFTATPNLAHGICYPTGALLGDGTVLIAGNAFYSTASAQLYDAAAGTFSRTGDMTTYRSSPTATLLNDGKVLLAGGYVVTRPVIASAELYTPPVPVPGPVLFSVSGDGQGQGAILHADTHQVVSSTNPARAGDLLEIYCTGLIDGSLIPPQLAIGGQLAKILFFGKAPGLAGVNQVNVRVPGGVERGPAVPVRLNYMGRPSNEVTIGVQ